jgi:hypothetical protein
VAALDNGQRRFTGTEALYLGRTSHTLELGLDLFFYVGHRNDHIDSALQAGQNFNLGLH